MKRARPVSSDPRWPAAGYPAAPPQPNYLQSEGYGPPGETYPLADESGHERGTGAKRVATTLGRARPPDPWRIVSVDPNSRMASALHPPTMPAAQVRVVSQAEAPVRAPLTRPPRLLYLRSLVAREHGDRRLLFATLALLVTVVFLAAILHYSFPASATSQAQAALVAGRLIAQTHSMRYVPPDPFSFVGEHWVAGEELVTSADGSLVQAYFPKDPAGLALLYAACYRLAPSADEAIGWAHRINPVAAAVAVLGVFYLCRFAGGSFLGILGMIAMATSQALLGVATDASGAAVSLALVTWGFFVLLTWWRGGNGLVGVLAGLLLGSAATVRYSEAWLLAPVLLASIFAWHWRRPLSSFLRVLAPIVGWLIPVAALVWWNFREMGAPTAYHLGGELGTLDADNVVHNFASVLGGLSGSGFSFLLPLGALGILTLLARRIGLGLVMLSWLILPGLAFAASVWNIPSQQKLPFALTIFPALLFGVIYLLRRVLYAPSDSPPQVVLAQDPYTGQSMHLVAEAAPSAWRAIAAPVAAGLVIAAAVFAGSGAKALAETPPEGVLAQQRDRDANMASLASFVRLYARPGAVLITDVSVDGGNAIYLLDLVGEWELYDAAMFSPRFARTLEAPWSPVTQESGSARPTRRRHEYLQHLYEGLGEEALGENARRIADRAIESRRDVYLLMSALDSRRFAQTHFLRGYEALAVAVFDEAPSVPQSGESGRQWVLVRIAPELKVQPPGTVVQLQ